MNSMIDQQQLSLTSRVRHRAVGEEGVLVHLESGRVIVVNEVGLHIVQQLASAQTRQTLTESIAGTFDIGTEQAAADLDLYLAELDKEQVLEYRNVQD